MKKLFTLLFVFLFLFGCSKKEIPDFESNFSIETYQCDMSGYKRLNSSDHMYVGTTVSELKKTIDEKGYGAFVLSRKGCPHCQIVMQYINQAAKDLGVNVYYIDAESSAYPIVGTDNYDVLDEILKPIEEELDGEIQLQTPHFFTVVNGKFVDSYIGVKFKNIDNPSEKEVSKLVNKYKDALKIFVH